MNQFAPKVVGQCPICQKPIISSWFDAPAKTKCGHTFHPKCLDIWLDNHLSCPVCQTTPCFDVTFSICNRDEQNSYRMISINGTWAPAQALLNEYNKGQTKQYRYIAKGMLHYSGTDIIQGKYGENTLMATDTFPQLGQPSNIVQHLSKEEFENFEQLLYGDNHKGSTRCMIRIPEHQKLRNVYDGTIIFTNRLGWLVRVDKPFCLGCLTHSGNTYGMRHYVIGNDGSIRSISIEHDTLAKPINRENIDSIMLSGYNYERLKSTSLGGIIFTIEYL